MITEDKNWEIGDQVIDQSFTRLTSAFRTIVTLN